MAGIFSPITIKNMNLKNRIVMPPMAMYKAAFSGEITGEMMDHYVSRAEAAVGLIIMEHSFVNNQGRVNIRQAGIHSEDLLEGYLYLTERVHAVGGVMGIQLNHGGTASRREVTGAQPAGPSCIRHPRGTDLPREMRKGEIHRIITDFGKAAALAKRAGFDMVEIHGAHGYLLNQFLSPLTNKRGDEYGGSRENRIRLLVEVVEEVREAVGKDYPVFFRLGGDDRMFGGLAVDDAHWVALRLVRAGIDVLDLSGGLGGYDGEGQGYFVYLAEAVKPVVDIPIMISGGIKDPAFADYLVESGKTDLVGVGRALLADSHWLQRAIEQAALSSEGKYLL